MFDLPGHILILTGPPGAGKTTAAKALAEASDSPAVHLHTDDFWHSIRKGAIPPYLPEAHRQNTVVLNVIAQAAAGYARGGYFVVVDGIVGPWFLPAFREVVQPLHYLVLRPDLSTALERCRLRGGNTLAAPDPIADLHRQFSELGDLERHVIATTGFSVLHTVLVIEQALAKGDFRLAT